MKLSRELWLQVEPLLAAALEMDPRARADWLGALEATHAEAAPVLRRMLETHERAERNRELETVPRIASTPGWPSTHAPGERVGPFELIRPLGHGGMGEVWLARQADGRVARDVALKLPALHQQGDVWRERFRRERDILARLEHPHIARLYDAGVTDSGQPWLAMEFVAGLSLSEHVESRPHSVPARLALFRQVLAAVAHAHRHLVVHRDLKPANILIDASGQVKLLDFGIAKLLDTEEVLGAAGDITRIGGRVMTLRYAAPEQVTGGPITTATDIYSLGVILHEMLTGLAPYRAAREGKALTDLMLLQEQTEVPSRLAVPKPLARMLAGDLDSIILKAMRRDPERRYASVELFDADVLAYLDKRPVKARAGTWRYLAGRFALRHKLPLATAAAVLVTLLGGLVMAERERRVAVTEKARAERHFASVRKLANTFIFDVHARIENLPGTLAAREMLIRTSLEYLDALAGETGKDPALMYEIAAAYRNIGNIQGQPGSANKGDLDAAIGNFEKSRSLFVALERLRPSNIAALREHWNLSYALARAYFLKADARWQKQIATTIELAGRVAASPGATPADRALIAGSQIEKAHLTSLMSGLGPGVEETMTHATASLEALVREEPGNVDLRVALATAYSRAGTALARSGRTPASVQQAIAYLRQSRALARELAAEYPDDRKRLAFAASTDFDIAQVHAIAGEHGDADRAIAEALAANAVQIARDPADVSLAGDRVKILAEATLIAHRLGDQPQAIARGREALVVAQRLPEGARHSRDVRSHVAEAKAYLGYALLASGSGAGARTQQLAALREARDLLAGAAAFVGEARAEHLGAIPEDDTQELDAARKRCDEALARLGSA